QEVFVKAYRSLSGYRSGSSFYTWLYRIASNHCLDLLRSKGRRPAESLDALLDEKGDSVEGQFAVLDNTRAASEAKALIGQILQLLPPDYRVVLTLREIEGLSYQEIADTMECSIDSVKARLRRARIDIEEKARHFLRPPVV